MTHRSQCIRKPEDFLKKKWENETQASEEEQKCLNEAWSKALKG